MVERVVDRRITDYVCDASNVLSGVLTMSESPSGPTPPERPSVFASLDHRQYLADWFAWKKEANPRFSHRAFARMAGQKSPSLALSVIAGRRNLTDAERERMQRLVMERRSRGPRKKR